MTRCPVCKEISIVSDILHKILKTKLLKCNSCDYHFVDCSNFTSLDIHKHQSDNSRTFGVNKSRNIEYVNAINDISSNNKIKSLLEIGTPSDCDFLKRIYADNGNDIKLYSHDIIKNNLPEYIQFKAGLHEFENLSVDMTLCIHTLEHIPPYELTKFIDNLKRISNNYMIEVPLCETRNRIIKSSINPHYSFFTEESILKLLNDKVQLIKTHNAIKIKKIKINEI